MIAFKITIDGKESILTGFDDWSILAAHITASRNDDAKALYDYLRLSVGGLSQENAEGISHHFRLPESELNIGSKIEIDIVETTEPDPPKKRYRSDAKVQENPFTDEEWKELRYKDYIELKKEFEPNEST